jgi:hypothetical protein
MSNTRSSPLPSNSPARIGCYLGLVAALVLLGSALHLITSDSPSAMPLKLAILAAGVIEALTCYYALLRNRVAWSFALALNGTLSVIFLLGAPKVRDAWDISLAVGFVPAALFIAVTCLLGATSDEY